ncbi:YciI family protein [Rhodococcus triatomae]|nr:hypothetical protein G419_04800 [Rhodococcus triatomae BKS 15-14]
MPLFLVTYVHPDPQGWKTHLGPHLEWIAAQVESGALRASGPTFTGENRTAALLFNTADRAELDSIIATDPYMEHGQVSGLTVAEWDPIFGMLNAESTQPGKSAEHVIREVLVAFGPDPESEN